MTPPPALGRLGVVTTSAHRQAAWDRPGRPEKEDRPGPSGSGEREWVISAMLRQVTPALNLGVGLEIRKHPIHIGTMQLCEVLEVHKLCRLGKFI